MKIHFENLYPGDSVPQYGLWFVNENMFHDDARQYCEETYQGDIIQYDPRLLTKDGRSELLEVLGINVTSVGDTYTYIKIGIMYDPTLGTIKRVGDGQEVALEGWLYGGPEGPGEYLEWYFDPTDVEYHNYVDNYDDHAYPFVCERVN